MWRCAWIVLWGGMSIGGTALARSQRPRFEPTDLELERPGVVDVDLQVGYLYGAQSRLVLPDFEVDFGITRRFGIAVDPNQLVLAAGIVFSPNENLDLSVVALAGLLPGADRAGALAGVSPKLVLWR